MVYSFRSYSTYDQKKRLVREIREISSKTGLIITNETKLAVHETENLSIEVGVNARQQSSFQNLRLQNFSWSRTLFATGTMKNNIMLFKFHQKILLTS